MVQQVAVSREFEARLRHAATGKLSIYHVSPAENGHLFRIREG